jgi:hypothetical protein
MHIPFHFDVISPTFHLNMEWDYFPLPAAAALKSEE